MPQEQIADYYNQTQNHYEKWWGLKENLSLHYGIWNEQTKSFKDALYNTNALMAKMANIQSDQYVLDAGCGVGGAAFYLAKEFNCKVEGVSLSKKQVALANEKALELSLANKTNFHLMDFTQTSFEPNSFDVIWACESVCHTENKSDFLKEAYRLLKPGGRIVMADFFIPDSSNDDPNNWVDKWAASWGVPSFSKQSDFIDAIDQTGFKLIDLQDRTKNIEKSALKMYKSSLLGAVPSEIYNFFNPKVSAFAKTHYKSGYYQYKALKSKLWVYLMLSADKT